MNLYIIFMLTTAIFAHFELINPVMRQLEIIDDTHQMIEHKYLAHGTFLLVSMLFAPFIFLVCMIPAWSDPFKEATLNSLLRD